MGTQRRGLSPESQEYLASTSKTGTGPDFYLLSYAATTIQAYFRGYRVRKHLRLERDAHDKVQHILQSEEANFQLWSNAALAIQRAWRSWRNKRIFTYYRDLIQFRERGDRRELLKSINPREAQLADAASGIHVRFRLGGTVFPPLVFYKIFTHIAVTDICSFCPRDYANELRKTGADFNNKPKKPLTLPNGKKLSTTTARSMHADDFELDEQFREFIRPDGTVGLRSTRGWYERVEHNGWRPISERVLVEEDPITTMTKLKRVPFFHFSPTVRREDKARRLKQRKREWMAKIYREGLLGPGATKGQAGPGGEQEEDYGADLDGLDLDDLDPMASELLRWTEHLDFEHYVSDWTSTACTLGTEAFVPELESEFLMPPPPPSHDLKGAMVSAGVPFAPYKGGSTVASGVTSTVTLR